MKRFRTDLHIHTVLSACADEEMSPRAIVKKALERKLDIIGITDHNTTLHAPLVRELAASTGLVVLQGVEVTTREEVHCLAYFENTRELAIFQQYLDEHLPKIPYKAENFGYQVLVDKDDNILRFFEHFLNVGISQSIEEVEETVHSLGGIFIPAHIERGAFGLYAQLGFLPETLQCDGMGIQSISTADQIRQKYGLLPEMPMIKASDAHCLLDIGSGCTVFEMEAPKFQEIMLALKSTEGRKIDAA